MYLYICILDTPITTHSGGCFANENRFCSCNHGIHRQVRNSVTCTSETLHIYRKSADIITRHGK